jgi:hypothetical protein
LEFSAPDGRGGLHYNPLRTFEYFQSFTPVARVGYSILIYRITRNQANAIRRQWKLEETLAEQP